MRMISILAAAACVIATPAMAEGTPAGSFEKQVKYTDLDLTTEAGVAELDQRLKNLIRRECASGGRDRAARMAEKACSAEAYASAETQVRFAVAQANAGRTLVATRAAASTAQTPGA